MTRPTQIAHDCGGYGVLAMLALAALAWVPVIAVVRGLL